MHRLTYWLLVSTRNIRYPDNIGSTWPGSVLKVERFNDHHEVGYEVQSVKQVNVNI